MAERIRLSNRDLGIVAGSGRSLDEGVALKQEGTGCLQVEAPIDRDKRQQGVQLEGKDTAQQAPGDTYGKTPVFEVADALCVRMLGKNRHVRLPCWARPEVSQRAVNLGNSLI